MMQKIILMTLFLMITACNDKVESNIEDLKHEKLDKFEEKKVNNSKSEDIFSKMGFNIDGEKVTIDMNKTNAFMKKLELLMQGKAEEIGEKIEQADINFTKGLGVELNGDVVAIDLNKTKDVLQQINILMKEILLDVNHTIH